MDELDLIRDYASVFGKGNNYHYYIFSKGGFTDGLLQAQQRGEVRQELTLGCKGNCGIKVIGTYRKNITELYCLLLRIAVI